MAEDGGPDGGDAPDIDVAIVGAGISGIGMAAHMQVLCPHRSFTVIERRAGIGGTWDLFRYPGVRSDSDMHTLGFAFEPWRHEKSIADGAAILEYLNRIADERAIRRHIRFGSKVVSADWDSAAALWRLELEQGANVTRLTARFLYLGSGYYDYDEPYDAVLPGRELFAGAIIHPQFWPEGFHYAGKQVVVIGSGATAVTIVPAMAQCAGHVTMLQRTPTWYGIRPAKDAVANFLRRILPDKAAYALTRWKNIRFQDLVFRRARKSPGKVGDYLTRQLRKTLGDKYDAATFTPPYGPWDQRLCLVPDGDLFEAMKAGKADIVTGHIERFDAAGITLKDGRHLAADVIVTATGLRLATVGKIAVSIDGAPVDFARAYYYKGCMFSNVPNLAAVFGYLNASWTLRADLDAEYICRLLNHMAAIGADTATPVMQPGSEPEEDNVFDFSSGYIERSRGIIPKSARTLPWRLSQDYLHDAKWMRDNPLDDGIIRFRSTASARAGQMEHAQ